MDENCAFNQCRAEFDYIIMIIPTSDVEVLRETFEKKKKKIHRTAQFYRIMKRAQVDITLFTAIAMKYYNPDD